ncbi:substrate-binding domain-containing protein [Streptomyces sp. NPDC060223]|uniref:substrate-binding domain-containing protein n=1 Tax=unclassified Streptomyces TaxID=2593676 RepID=UPI003643BE44
MSRILSRTRWAAIAAASAATMLITTACGSTGAGTASPGGQLKVAMVPKLVGLAVFKANQQGAEKAAAELNIKFNYTGPVDASAQGQVQVFNSLIAQRYNVITTTANNPSVLAPTLVQARKQGIKVISYDSDVLPEARDFFVQNTDLPAMGKALVDCVAKPAGSQAEIAILSSTPDATIQNQWIKAVKDNLSANHPGIKIVTTQYGQSSPSHSLTAAQNILQAYPNVKAIIAPDGAAEAAAAEAVQKLGKAGKVFVTGTSDPASIRQYVKSGVIPCSPLWDETKEGELVMHVARLAYDNKIGPNSTFTAGDLGSFTAKDGVITFSEPLIFTKNNIDDYQW